MRTLSRSSLSRRRAAAVLTAAAVVGSLTACTGPDVPDPEPTARALVDALTAGDLDGVELAQDTSGDPQVQLTEVLEPLLTASGVQAPDVTLDGVDVVEEGDDAGRRATATLAWTWPLGAGAEWSYLTQADLAYAEAPEGSDGPGTWSVAWEPEVLVPGLEPGERLTVATDAPARADILDGAGAPLVTNRAVWRLGVDKTHVPREQWEGVARTLAGIVTEGGVAVDADAYVERVLAAGDKAFVELVTVRQESPGVDVEAARSTPGVGVIAGEMALAPTSSFARPILGRAGEATAELIEKSEGRLAAGDITGLSGLQRQYDAQLAGTAGVVVTAQVPDGDGEPRELFTKAAVDGTPLATTFDVALQTRAESLLAQVEPASAIVAIRPSTGEVLAAASGPGGKGLDTAMLGAYAPGSTFKVVGALALGRAGVTPDTSVPCTPTITVDGRQFSNVPGYDPSALGDIPLRTAIAHSCNTAMISQREVVSQADLVAAARDLGLGVETPVGTPVLYGSVPTDATAVQHAATLLGQDRIEVSPFTMARVAASVAAGHRVDPVLVRPQDPVEPAEPSESAEPAEPSESAEPAESAEAAESAESAEPAEPADVPDSGLTSQEAETLRSLMRGVVDSGSASMLADVPGIVGAKTGTAQFGDGSQQHTWMIAIAGDLAVAVFVEVGDRGSSTSGPIMHAFLTGG